VNVTVAVPGRRGIGVVGAPAAVAVVSHTTGRVSVARTAPRAVSVARVEDRCVTLSLGGPTGPPGPPGPTGPPGPGCDEVFVGPTDPYVINPASTAELWYRP
jgi:hypothetical protein